MDKTDLLSMIDTESKPTKTRGKKRKWREIEAIQDRYRLRKELEELGMSADAEYDSLDY